MPLRFLLFLFFVVASQGYALRSESGQSPSWGEAVGKVKGRVYDPETNLGLSNVMLRINDAETFSNDQGFFEFSALRAGTYFFGVDSTSLPSNRVPVEMLPKEIEIKTETVLTIDVALTWAANLTGKVVVYRVTEESKVMSADVGSDAPAPDKPSSAAAKTNRVSSYGLNKALIELSNDRQVRRRVSDRSGRFEFRGLPSGKWTIRISDFYLPEDHYLEQHSTEIELPPRLEKEVLVSIFPNRQNFQIVDESVSELLNPEPDTSAAVTTAGGTEAFHPAESVTYIVKRGDWLSKIAGRFYGDVMLYAKILDANRDIILDPNLIFPGQELTIPEVGKEVDYYTVRRGDWLTKIALRFYGTLDYRQIYQANRTIIPHPDLIYPGQTLFIPAANRDPIQSAAQASVNTLPASKSVSQRSQSGQRKVGADEPPGKAVTKTGLRRFLPDRTVIQN